MENLPALSFPQYRRYKNKKSYFCFEGPDRFEEIRQFGSKWLIDQHTVKILPDRNLVYDLLYDFHAFAEEVSAAEYLEIKAKTA